MSSHREVRDLVDRYQLRAKKRLGQNFLVDGATLDGIAHTAARETPDGFIEIGPGPGTLTRRLAAYGRPMVAIEKDPTLVEMLHKELASFAHLRIVPGDALAGDLADYLPSVHRPAVAGNIPYNISSPLIVRLVGQRHRLGPVTLLLQREVVDRLLALPGSKAYGRLSVLLQMHAHLQRGRTVPAGSFWPPPRVESAVIHWTWRDVPAAPMTDPQHFETVVRAAFGQRRKKLRNALRTEFDGERIEACRLRGFDLEQRAEQLSLSEFASLAELLRADGSSTD